MQEQNKKFSEEMENMKKNPNTTSKPEKYSNCVK